MLLEGGVLSLYTTVDDMAFIQYGAWVYPLSSAARAFSLSSNMFVVRNRSAAAAGGTRRPPFNLTPMGAKSLSPAHLHPHGAYVWVSWRNQEKYPPEMFFTARRRGQGKTR